MDDLGAGQQLGELVAAVLRRLDDLDADARLLQFPREVVGDPAAPHEDGVADLDLLQPKVLDGAPSNPVWTP